MGLRAHEVAGRCQCLECVARACVVAGSRIWLSLRLSGAPARVLGDPRVQVSHRSIGDRVEHLGGPSVART